MSIVLNIFFIISDKRFAFSKIYRKFDNIRCYKHLRPFIKSKFNLKFNRVNLVAPASPIEWLLHLPNDRAIQYKLGPENFTRLGNSNVLRLPVVRAFANSIMGHLQTYPQRMGIRRRSKKTFI